MSKKVRLAAVQASSVFLDKDATVEKAIGIIREAGEKGVSILGFPEGFIPEMPLWYFYHPATSGKAFGFTKRLAENAITVPGPEILSIADAAKEANVFVVIGVCERLADRPGVLYNTQVFIDEHGHIVGRRRKLMPTVGEILVHTPANSLDLAAYPAADGARVSGLLCGENSNPSPRLPPTRRGRTSTSLPGRRTSTSATRCVRPWTSSRDRSPTR